MNESLSFFSGLFIAFTTADAWAYAKAVQLMSRPLFNFWPGSGFYELNKAVHLYEKEEK